MDFSFSCICRQFGAESLISCVLYFILCVLIYVLSLWVRPIFFQQLVSELGLKHKLLHINQMAGKSSGFMVELFNGHNDFTLWQQRVKNILTQEKLVKTLQPKAEKSKNMKDDD